MHKRKSSHCVLYENHQASNNLRSRGSSAGNPIHIGDDTKVMTRTQIGLKMKQPYHSRVHEYLMILINKVNVLCNRIFFLELQFFKYASLLKNRKGPREVSRQFQEICVTKFSLYELNDSLKQMCNDINKERNLIDLTIS